MKLTEIIERDKKNEFLKNQEILKQSKEIKNSTLEQQLTRALWRKDCYKNYLKNDNINPVSKAKVETDIFKLDEIIKKLKKELSEIWLDYAM